MTAGSPASRTYVGSARSAGPVGRAMPRALRRRTSRSASARSGSGSGASPYTRSARSQSFSRPVLPRLTGDRDLVALEHVPEHLLDVLVVGPAGRAPRALAGVGQLGGRQRSLGSQGGQDVLAALLVGREPVGDLVNPGLEVAAPGPVRRLGAVQRQVLDRPVEAEVVHEPLVLDRRLQLVRVVRRPEPRPAEQVVAGRDRRRRLGRQQRQVTDCLQQVGRPVSRQQLRLERDPSAPAAG